MTRFDPAFQQKSIDDSVETLAKVRASLGPLAKDLSEPSWHSYIDKMERLIIQMRRVSALHKSGATEEQVQQSFEIQLRLAEQVRTEVEHLMRLAE